ncbi:hypothetical protein [Ensifer canadensis]
MDTLLKVAGALVILISAGAAVAATMPSFGAPAVMLALQWALPAIGIGIALAAFGSMLGQLKRIRLAAERQADLFQSILDRRQPAK